MPTTTAGPPRRRSTKSLLTSYQRDWVRDRRRRKLWVKSRRIGGSFGVALECALAAAGIGQVRHRGPMYYRPERGIPQRIVSASHAQAKGLLEQCAQHLEVLSEAVVGKPLIAKQSVERIELVNGARLYALAPNPRTVRGGEGDVTIDEMGVMPFSDKIWAASKAITDPTLKNPYGYRLRIVGTPCGDDNMFYKLACTEAGSAFSRHFTDIHTAVKAGFPADIDELRLEAGTEDIFQQEYECAFLSAIDRYIPAELYDACVYDITSELPRSSGPGYAGMDVARKATGDLSAMYVVRRLAERLWHVGGETRRGESWDAQEGWVGETFQQNVQRMAVDATGLGSQFAERMQQRHGSRVEPFEFTNKSKEQLASGLRMAMERGTLKLRDDDAELRRDVLSLRREQTQAGNVRYSSGRNTERDGKKSHADRAWALALAVEAAGTPVRYEHHDIDDEDDDPWGVVGGRGGAL